VDVAFVRRSGRVAIDYIETLLANMIESASALGACDPFLSPVVRSRTALAVVGMTFPRQRAQSPLLILPLMFSDG